MWFKFEPIFLKNVTNVFYDEHFILEKELNKFYYSPKLDEMLRNLNIDHIEIC